MLLLTSLAFGGAESVESFEHLPDDESELLKHRAQALLQVPKDKRIPFLVQEIKRLVTNRRKQLGSAEPGRLAELLSRERGATVEVLLRALPSALAEAVRHELPPRAPIRLKREVSAAVLSIVRWKLEEALKQGGGQVGTFKFTDLLTLQARELLAICDRMGARALATAFAGLGDGARDELFVKLTPDQRALAVRATEAGRARRLSEPDSRTVLEIFGGLSDPSMGMRSAGAQRLVRSCLAQGPEFLARMIERHPNELGRLLQRWVRDERARVPRGDGGRMDIVEQMERLAQRGVIDRPMRLPPPPRALPPAPRADSRPVERAREAGPGSEKGLPRSESRSAVAAPQGGGEDPRAQGKGASGEQLLAPPPRLRDPNAQRSAVLAPGRRAEIPAVARPAAQVPQGFRDVMAQRAARKAGVLSSRLPQGRGEVSGSAPSARIMRDGKLMRSTGSRAAVPRPRALTASPPLQEIPKRRDGTPVEASRSGPQKAVVLKNRPGNKG